MLDTPPEAAKEPPPRILGLLAPPTGLFQLGGVASIPDCTERTFVHIPSAALPAVLRAEEGVTAAGKSADRDSE